MSRVIPPIASMIFGKEERFTETNCFISRSNVLFNVCNVSSGPPKAYAWFILSLPERVGIVTYESLIIEESFILLCSVSSVAMRMQSERPILSSPESIPRSAMFFIYLSVTLFCIKLSSLS